VLRILGSYLRNRTLDGRKMAPVIHFAETIAPAGDISSMGTEDRNSLNIMKRWAQDPAFLRSDVIICLVAENRSELNQSIAARESDLVPLTLPPRPVARRPQAARPAEEHIALFYPDTNDERLAIFRVKAGSLSGADVESVLVRARMLAATQGREDVMVDDLKQALEDFIRRLISSFKTS
jgi:hypothetical protein